MKKIVLLLLAFSLVAGQALFAQVPDGLKIDGHVETGVNITKAHGNSNGNAAVRAYSDDADAVSRARLNFVYTKDNVGAQIRFEGVPGTGADIGHAFGWFGFFNDMFEVSAGWLDNPKWGTVTGFHINDNMDNGNLVKLEVKPIDGLSLGVNLFDVKRTNGSTSDFVSTFDNAVYGVKYGNDSFKVSFEAGGHTSFGYDVAYATNSDNKRFYKNLRFHSSVLGDIGQMGGSVQFWDFGMLFSFVFTGVENLKIEADAAFARDRSNRLVQGTAADVKMTALGISAQGTYTIDKLDVGAQIDYGYGSGEGTVPVMGTNGVSLWELGIIPKVSYDVTEWLKADIDIPIRLRDHISGSGSIEEPKYKDWNSGFSFGVKPKFSFDMGNGVTFITFYELDAYKAGYAKGATAPDTQFTHTVQFDFIWVFK